MYESSTGDWVLIISSVKKQDAGRYECQVSSAPPMGHFVYLNFKEPETKILGGPDIHINLGSTLNLTCLVLYHQRPPDVTWLHRDQVVGYQSARGGVNVVTESGEATRSSLLIQRAALSDAGTYTCRAHGGREDSITAHVLSEKLQAAMHGSSNSQHTSVLMPSFVAASLSYVRLNYLLQEPLRRRL
ncbi:kin of IRRE-like protein 3 [Hyalella azteca]|uniref:Kin of IRRE-like protein 3 n=1 Tax=Hyalella azteca TaxID=294128 RepID=A0A979FJ43_HYAAZ|nr:kin of IRRE-like protein 3 [Hyalella azteca]